VLESFILLFVNVLVVLFLSITRQTNCMTRMISRDCHLRYHIAYYIVYHRFLPKTYTKLFSIKGCCFCCCCFQCNFPYLIVGIRAWSAGYSVDSDNRQPWFDKELRNLANIRNKSHKYMKKLGKIYIRPMQQCEYDAASQRFLDLKGAFKGMHRLKYAQYIERVETGRKSNPRYFFKLANLKKKFQRLSICYVTGWRLRA
jgi:hypothetical protein